MIRNVKSGQQLRKDDWNEVADISRRLTTGGISFNGSRFDSSAGRNGVALIEAGRTFNRYGNDEPRFIARVISLGSEDYTDERYWVLEQWEAGAGTPRDQKDFFDRKFLLDNGERNPAVAFGVAHNLSEIGTATHSVPVGTLIECWIERDTSGQSFYAFTHGGGVGTTTFVAFVTSTDPLEIKPALAVPPETDTSQAVFRIDEAASALPAIPSHGHSISDFAYVDRFGPVFMIDVNGQPSSATVPVLARSTPLLEGGSAFVIAPYWVDGLSNLDVNPCNGL